MLTKDEKNGDEAFVGMQENVSEENCDSMIMDYYIFTIPSDFFCSIGLKQNGANIFILNDGAQFPTVGKLHSVMK